MILYHPTEGYVFERRINKRPKTCFLMTKLGSAVPARIRKIRYGLNQYLTERNISIIDANSIRTGGDFLFKIW